MKKKRNLIIFVIICVFLFVASFFNFTKPIKNAIWSFLEPVSIVAQGTFGKTPQIFKDIFNFRSIVRQNSKLFEENLALQSELAKLSEVQYENEILKKELGFLSNEKKYNLIPVKVVGSSPDNVKNFVLDKGNDSNLKVGQAVVSNGFLVGIISEVRSNNSDLTLITDYNVLVPVIFQQSRSTGLLRGGLKGLVVDDVPLNTTINEQEMIITSGLGGLVPQGITVGKAKQVISKQGEIFQKIAVESPVDFSTLKLLFVIEY